MVGIVLSHYKETLLQNPLFYIILAIVTAYSLWADWRMKSHWPLVLLIIIGCGFAMGTLSDKRTIPTIPYNEQCTFTASVLDQKHVKGKYQVIECQTISYKDSTNIWRGENQRIELNIDTALKIVPHIGNTLVFTGKLRYIDGSYGDWMRGRGIVGKLYTYRAQIIDSTLARPTFNDRLNAWREAMASRIDRIDTIRPNETATMSALTIGHREDMSREIKQEYRRAGASHLLAISGLHVGIIVTILNFMFGFVRLWPRGRIVFGVVVIALIWIYALFTGMSASVMRASIMFSLFQVGVMTSRGSSQTSILATAALIILIIDPQYLFDIGFQLSFMAMVGITTMYRPIKSIIPIKNRALDSLWGVTVVSFTAQIAVLPLIVFYFGQIPLLGLIINIAVWITVPLIILGTILYLASSLTWIGIGAMYVAMAQNYIIKAIAEPSWATIDGLKINILGLVFIYIIEVAVAIFITTATQKRLRRKVLSAKYNL